MTTSRLAAVCDPTQWIQSLIAINIQVNQETHRYAITKKVFQGSLSTAIAVTCIPACGSEILKLFADISCKATGGAIRRVQRITNSAGLESFHQTVSGRPNLPYRLERIVGQAFGLLISAVGTFFLFILRDDWAIQQHQSLGNYIPSKPPTLETTEERSLPQEVSEPLNPVPTPPSPPSVKASSTSLKSALKASPKTQAPPSADDTGASLPLDPTSLFEGQVLQSPMPASSEPPLDTSSTADATSSAGKKKGVRIISTPTTDERKPAPSPLDELRRKGEQQSSKGEEIAAKLQEEERAKQKNKTLSAEGKLMSDALSTQKAKVRRHQSSYFKGFDANLGNIVEGKIILRDLAHDLKNIPFSTEEKILSGTFSEYVLLKFEEEKTPVKVHQVCVITNEEWDQTFTITIVKTEKDPTTGKDTILEAAISW